MGRTPGESGFGLSLGKVAKYCGVTRKTILRWINEGILNSYTLPSGHHRILHEELARFLSEHDMPIPPELRQQAQHNVLVVDIEQSSRELVSDLLQPHFHVSTAPTAIEACFTIGRQTPDLLLFDINVPCLDGIELCRLLRSSAAYNSMGIVVLASRMDLQTGSMLDRYVDTILPKPFAPAQLVNACLSAAKIET